MGVGLIFTNIKCRTVAGALLKLWVTRRKTGSICPAKSASQLSVTAWTGAPRGAPLVHHPSWGEQSRVAPPSADGQALCATDDLPISRRLRGSAASQAGRAGHGLDGRADPIAGMKDGLDGGWETLGGCAGGREG
jgi:hypothetical protein